MTYCTRSETIQQLAYASIWLRMENQNSFNLLAASSREALPGVKALGVSQQGLMRDSLPRCHSNAVALDAQKAGVLRRTQVTCLGIVGREKNKPLYWALLQQENAFKDMLPYYCLCLPFLTFYTLPHQKFGPYLINHNVLCALLARRGDPFNSESFCIGTAMTICEVVRICPHTEKFSEQQPYLCICYAKHTYVCFLLNNSILNNERASPELLRKNVWCRDLPCLH